MAIFTKKKEQKDKSQAFVGAFLPLQLAEYLSLYALVTRTGKSNIINKSVELWKQDIINQCSPEYLCEELKKQALEFFIKEKSFKGFNFWRFLNSMKKEMVKKGIEEKVVEAIINYVRNEAIKDIQSKDTNETKNKTKN